MSIEADHYRHARAALATDPVIVRMARELPADWRLTLTHGPDDRPTYNFMVKALDEYKRRGGTIPTHIGGPAEAIIQVRKLAAVFDALHEPEQDPDETNEGLERLDLRDALQMIAYPRNWPQDRINDPPRTFSLALWMQSVAANALTNAGTYNYERKAKP